MRTDTHEYQLNLAHKPFANTVVPKIILSIIVLAVLAFSIFNVAVLFSSVSEDEVISAQINSTQDEIDQLRSEIADIDKELGKIEVGNLIGEIRTVNTLINQRSLNWTRLFDRLERLAPPELRMLRISPNVRNDLIELSFRVEVPRQEVIREFMRALENSIYFNDIRLLSESSEAEGGITFQMTSEYIDQKEE